MMGYLAGYKIGYGVGYYPVVMTSAPFNPAFPDSQTWEDSTPGRDYTPVHFTTTVARDAYVAALSRAHAGSEHKAVIDKYVGHAHGGYWGTVGEAL
jgi:hypothetical protein